MKKDKRPAVTAKRLSREISDYFDSISRRVVLTEWAETGEMDAKGKPVTELRAVKNVKGESVVVTEYADPPCIGELCARLNITRREWETLREGDGETGRAALMAEERIRAYLDRQLLVREGKDVRGVIFHLENNFDCAERHSVEGSGVSIVIEGDAAGCDE